MSQDKNLYLDIHIDTKMAEGHIKYLRPYLDTVLRRTVGDNEHKLPVLEVGIGTGLCSIFLESQGVNAYAIDIEPDIVNRFNREIKPAFNSHVKTGIYDAFNLTPVMENIGTIGCIHHQGLLEHFSMDEVKKMLDHQVRCTVSYVVFAVPIKGHKDSEYDEEEYRHTLNEWIAFLSENYLVFEFGVFGMDNNHNQAYFVINKYKQFVEIS